MVVDGNGVSEFIANMKNSFDALGNLEYTADCKLGVVDADPRHFITKFLYDALGNLTKTEIATHQRYTGATDITVDLTVPAVPVITCTGADFAEAVLDDRLYINTILNPTVWVRIQSKVSATSVIIKGEDAALLTAEAATPVAATDIILELNNEATLDYVKRRWDLRASYLYL